MISKIFKSRKHSKGERNFISTSVLKDISFLNCKTTNSKPSKRFENSCHPSIHPSIFPLIPLYQVSLKRLPCLEDRGAPSPKQPIPSLESSRVLFVWCESPSLYCDEFFLILPPTRDTENKSNFFST